MLKVKILLRKNWYIEKGFFLLKFYCQFLENLFVNLYKKNIIVQISFLL